MVLARVPPPVMAGVFSLKVCPADTLNTTGVVMRPQAVAAFSQLMAAEKLAKLVPPVGRVLLMVNGLSVEGGVGRETSEMLSTDPACCEPQQLSLFHVKM